MRKSRINHLNPNVLTIEQSGVFDEANATLTVSKALAGIGDTKVAVYIRSTGNMPVVWLTKDEALLVIAQITSLLDDEVSLGQQYRANRAEAKRLDPSQAYGDGD